MCCGIKDNFTIATDRANNIVRLSIIVDLYTHRIDNVSIIADNIFSYLFPISSFTNGMLHNVHLLLFFGLNEFVRLCHR